MSGIGMVLDIATSALIAQQQSIDVTAHNIANVNTDGYSRQSPDLEAKMPVVSNGLIMGRGVNVQQVIQSSDQFIENRLMQENSNLSSSTEMEKYLQVVEGYFNETSDTGMSTMLNDFWNNWYDISNNPSGSAERSTLYEKSTLLAEQFNELGNNLTQVKTDLTNSVSSGVESINKITNEIAQLNNQIVGMENDNTANDLRDKRTALVSELNQYLDVKTFEQSNGSLTIISAKGCTLVQGNSSYDLEMGAGDRVIWQNSSGGTVDITDYISNGKLGGWLDLRDDVIAKYQLNLDALANQFIWAVNQQHSQGVGLEGFSTVTSSNAADTGALTADSNLDYHGKIKDGAFNLWVYDSTGAVVSGSGSANPINVTAGTTTLSDLCNEINTAATNIGAPITASITTDGKLKIDAASGYTFAFSDDTSNVLAALGINTFFTGSNASNMGVNDIIGVNQNNIAAGQVGSDGTIAAGSNANALAVTDLQNTSMNISQWTCDRVNGNTQGSTLSTINNYYNSLVGSIGIDSASASRDKSFAETMVNEISNMRDSISGVSLDEELTNLIKYQHAYGAAAKLISTSDEMLTTLLNTKQ